MEDSIVSFKSYITQNIEIQPVSGDAELSFKIRSDDKDRILVGCGDHKAFFSMDELKKAIDILIEFGNK